MEKTRKRDKLFRYLPFRPSYPGANGCETPSQVSTSGASSTLAQTSLQGADPKTSSSHTSPSEHHIAPPAMAEAYKAELYDSGNEEPAASSPINSNVIEPQSLWVKAFNQMSSSESATLAPFHSSTDKQDVMPMLEEIQMELKHAVASKNDSSWTITWRGKTIVLRDVAMKIVQWVDKFKQVGDIAIQYDPGHAALPWAAFRFVLQVCMNKQSMVDAVLIGLEKTSNLIDRCAIYESVYLRNINASKNLAKAILQLYVAILKYLANAIQASRGELLLSGGV